MTIGVQGKVGPRGSNGDGTDLDIRLGRGGDVAVFDSRTRYGELTQRGQVFSVATALAGTTIVAGNVSPVGAAAASILSIWNPSDSGANAEVIKAWLVFVSGTPGAGTFVWNMAWNQTVTATENAAPACGLVSGARPPVKGFTQTALTGSAAQVVCRVMGISLFAGAVAASSPVNYVDQVDGDIVVPPGGLLSIAAPAAGTTCIVAAGIEFAMIPRANGAGG